MLLSNSFVFTKHLKSISLLLIFSLLNLCIIDCSKKNPTEPVSDDLEVSNQGIANGNTNKEGNIIFNSPQLGHIKLTIKDKEGNKVGDLPVSYYEETNLMRLFHSDSNRKHKGFFITGSPERMPSQLGKAANIQEPQEFVIAILFGAITAVTFYFSYVKATEAFEEIDMFWTTDEVYNHLGEKVGVEKTPAELFDYIKAKKDYEMALISMVLAPIPALSTSTTIALPGLKVIGEKLLELSVETFTEVLLEYYKQNKKTEWMEASPNLTFLVREYNGKMNIGDGVIQFLGLDIQPYTNFQQVQFQKAEFSLPYPLSNLAKLTAYSDDKDVVYIFGGYRESYGWSNSILRVNPANNNIQTLSTSLPFSNDGNFIVCNNPQNRLIYLFRYQDVYTFDPNTESFQKILTNSSPESIGDYSIAKFVSSNNSIYIFGNRGSGRGNFILKFDPITNQFLKLNTNYSPSNNILTGIAYSDQADAIYLFGGTFSNSYYNSIQKFNPQAHSISAVGAQMPVSSGGNVSSYVMDNNKIYIFGGEDYSTALKHIFEFDCSSEQILKLMDMPQSMSHSGAEYIPSLNRIYILGGTIAKSGGFIPATNDVYYLQL